MKPQKLRNIVYEPAIPRTNPLAQTIWCLWTRLWILVSSWLANSTHYVWGKVNLGGWFYVDLFSCTELANGVRHGRIHSEDYFRAYL